MVSLAELTLQQIAHEPKHCVVHPGINLEMLGVCIHHEGCDL